MRFVVMSFLGVVSIGAVALAEKPVTSTYTPGRAEASPQPYSLRRSAVTPARGGGPGVDTSVHNVPSTSRLPTSLQSDNQTRRPGAINYTMHPRNKDEVRTGHAVPYPSGVNIAGDHFESHTGSSSSGMIGVRAADSNEETFRAEPTARGGGPAATERYLAPEMQRAPHVTGQRVLEHFAGLPALSKGDIASLPSRGDGTAAPNDGLLALDPTIRSSQLNDTTGHVAASPSVIRLQTRYPATVRAIGGGPPDATVQAPNQPDALQRALDRVPGN